MRVFLSSRLVAVSALLLVLASMLSSSYVNAFSVRPTISSKTLIWPTPIAHEASWTRPTLITRNDHQPYRQLSKRAPLAGANTREEDNDDDPLFDARTTISLVGGQSLLIVAAILAAWILRTPNYGLGPGLDYSQSALIQGTLCAIPIFAIAYALDSIEERVPALQDVTKATQRSVLALFGGTFKPLLAVTVSVILGLVAGFGEEMLFRGVMQYELSERFGTLLAVSVSSAVFGFLHAVTPLYALLATLASVFFGSLYVWSDNLAVPIVTHAVYDIGALLWAHWTVTQMTPQERWDIAHWQGPKTSSSLSTSDEGKE